MIRVDEYGLVSQIQKNGTFEGGDTANHEGHRRYMRGGSANVRPYRDIFEVGCGGYVRHPVPESTTNGFGAVYYHPWGGCISRDQLIGIIAGLISEGDYWGIIRLMFHHACRGFLFSYNTIHNGSKPEDRGWKMPDLTLFDIWAIELRGLGVFSWVFWPLLCVLDLHNLGNTVVQNCTSVEKDNECISYLMRVFISVERVPTPISLLSRAILNERHVIKKLVSYWTGWRDNPHMGALYADMLTGTERQSDGVWLWQANLVAAFLLAWAYI